MFGLFKSRKKQQQERADEEQARREEAEAAADASVENGADAGDAAVEHPPGAPEQAADEQAADEQAENERVDTADGSPTPEADKQADRSAEPSEDVAEVGDVARVDVEEKPADEAAAGVDEGSTAQNRPDDAVKAPAHEEPAPVEWTEPQPPAATPYDPAPREEAAAQAALSESLPAESAQSAVEEVPAAQTREAELATDVTPEPASQAPQEKPKRGWLARVRAGLGRTRANLTDGIADLLVGKKQIDEDLLEDLETQLLMADVGIDATSEIIERLTARVRRKELSDADALYRALQDELSGLLESVSQPLSLPPKGQGPFVILMVGVNGVGKTTTIGKLTQRFQNEGRSVMLAAGDTFRAAAVEQLKVWGERNRVPVIAQHTGADSASVIYDALAAARARKVDVLIADTAGRLHNKSHLMEELKKVQRVMAKLDAEAPHEVMLVLDAGTGQNAISQATTFDEAIPVTGITLTKLDGTAKGGIIFALAKKTGTPIRFIGVGETLDDLRPFDADTFVKALFGRDAEQEDDSAS
ncbi:signal recognition particle-docking protein FtsY [Salinicola rhizosphaerae]|uniref:Signal recognition particle receptor FtsY n=1 Tax=Salinicola rhizosphaerae TaxID=1443141 RepID=A0ABQ3DXI8_9GAMM|nr:signal recognition particle-docking protein FtsY [Salinicola rhizosphaerae]GHB19652.1 signal recognition particle receptor FtsY [Salinicola rhizosphaerae]